MSDSASTSSTGRCRELHADIPPTIIEGDLEVVSALANETRYRIIRLLDEHDEVCVCDIDASLRASQSAISHALSKLHQVGLVDRRKEGRWRYYRNTTAAEAILAALDDGRASR